jgi:hypothetical protein
MKVFLEYSFLFDAVDTWQHLYQFESDLAKFFSERGLEAEIIKTVEGQASGRRILAISKKNNLESKVTDKARGRPQSIKGRISDFKRVNLRAPAVKFQKEGDKKLKGFERVMRKAGK